MGKERKSFRTEKLVDWLWIGEVLGSLKRISRQKLIDVLGDRACEQSVISVLCDAGRADCVATTADGMKLVLADCLSRVPSEQVRGLQAPLFILPAFFTTLSVNLAGPIYASPLGEGVFMFREKFYSASVPELSLEADGKAYEMSRRISEVYIAAGGEQRSLGHWDDIVNECEREWGTAPAIVAAAIGVCNSRRKMTKQRQVVDLYDTSIPLCTRLGAARNNNADLGWWKEQLSNAEVAEQQFVFQLCFWAWVNEKIEHDLGIDVGRALDLMTFEQWDRTGRFVSDLWRLHKDRKGKLHEIEDLIVRSGSRRLALMLAVRYKNGVGREIVTKYVLSNEKDEKIAAQLRQFFALKSAILKQTPWSAALQVVGETYRDGAFGYRSSLLSQHPERLPGEVTQAILSNPNDYPISVWEYAEGAATAEVRRGVRPVGTVAKSENWFVQ